MSVSGRPYRTLRHRDFRGLWLAQLVSLTGSQMQVAALHWHLYLLTRSPLALGLIGLTRVVPIVAFSLWGGVLADRRDRRAVMFGAQSMMALASLALTAATLLGHDSAVTIYVAAAVTAAALAFDAPARQALVPRLVPELELPAALALNLTAFHASMIVGPALAGLLIAHGGPAGATLAQAGASGAERAALGGIYGLNALSFVGVLFVLATMRASGRVEPAAGGHEPLLDSLRTGLRFVFETPLLVWTLGLDFFATFFSGALSLLPIVADRLLGVGAAGYGWLSAGTAVGALAGSLYTSVRPLPRRQGRVLLAAVAVYGLATVAYGLSRSFLLTFAALAIAGLADLISTVIRQTLRQLITPDALRGRMTAVNMIFFMGGPQLGELEAGFVASLFASATLGVTVSVVSGGLATLAVVALTTLATPVLRSYRSAV